MRRIAFTLALALIGSTSAVAAQEHTMKIQMHIGDQVIPATLEDNPTSRDFIALLPLTLTLEDYAKTEKINYLEKKLTADSALVNPHFQVQRLSYSLVAVAA